MNKLLIAGLEASFQVLDMRTQNPTNGFASVTEKVNQVQILKKIRLKGHRQSGQQNICLKIEIYL